MAKLHDWKKKREEDLEIERALVEFLAKGGTPEYYEYLSEEKARANAEFEAVLKLRRAGRDKLGTTSKKKGRTKKILSLAEAMANGEVL